MNKAFDCVKMKSQLQAELQEQEQRLGAEEFGKQRQQWLAKSEDSLARWWRSISSLELDEKKVLALREDAVSYRTKTDPKS